MKEVIKKIRNKKKNNEQKGAHFNVKKFTDAFEIRNTNIDLAIQRFEDYLEEYPTDYNALTHYASTLISIGELEKAEKILNQVTKYINEDKKYNLYPERKEKCENVLLFVKLQLLLYSNRYNECYWYIKIYSKRFMEMDVGLEAVKLICENKLGLPHDLKIEEDKYLYNQIVDYSKERFLDHVLNHLVYDEEDQKPAIFNNDFPFDRVLEEIYEKLPTAPKLYVGLIEDVSVYKYNACGRSNYHNADYIRVITIHDTSNIITMYPYTTGKYLPYIDLNYLKEEPKIKKIGQIDKFNMKYGKKLDK